MHWQCFQYLIDFIFKLKRMVQQIIKYSFHPGPFFGVQLLKQGLHLETFDPSPRMIELGKAGSMLVYLNYRY